MHGIERQIDRQMDAWSYLPVGNLKHLQRD